MKTKLQAALIAILTLSALAYLWANRSAFLSTLFSADLSWVVLALAFHLANYLLRSARLCLLARKGFGFYGRAFRISGAHGTLAYLLPMQAGDLALPKLLADEADMRLGDGFRLLVWTRLLDFFGLGAVILASGALLAPRVPHELTILWWLAGILFVLSPFIFVNFLRLKRFLPEFLSKHADFLHLGENPPLMAGAVSALIWIMVAGLFYSSARALGLSIGPGEAVFVVSVQLPLQILPIQGLANAGNHEVGWTTALLMLGLGAKDAARFALASHAVVLLAVGFVALITGLLWMMGKDSEFSRSR